VVLGSETPRIFTPPLRRLTPKTSAGFACIEFAEEVIGLPLLPWQRWLLIHALELLPDGTFRFRTVVLLVARQSGKSTVLQILALYFMYVRGVALVIGTAQNLDIAEEVWQGAVSIAEDVPELASEIENVNRTNGKKALELRQGERYKVQAANRRGGRGLSGDLVLMDELREHQTWAAWAAVTKTTMARQYAQVWAASNAGDSASIVLQHLRLMAHVALGDPDNLRIQISDTPDDVDMDDESLGIFEWSADPHAAPGDTAEWAQANPAMGYTITERAIRSAWKTDPEQVFRTEVLCQWPDTDVDDGPAWHLIPEETWTARGGGTPGPGWLADPVTLAVEMPLDRSSVSVAVAGQVGDRIGFDLVERRPGTSWAAEFVAALAADAPVANVVIDEASPAGKSDLPRDLEALGVPVLLAKFTDVKEATGGMLDALRSGSVLHRDDPVLTAAVGAAHPRFAGDALLVDRKASDAAPFIAACLARWGHLHGQETESIYETRGVFVLP
jgi:phage terminase large subunit-like protein